MSTLSAVLKGISRGRDRTERQEQLERAAKRQDQLFKLTMEKSKRDQANTDRKLKIEEFVFNKIMGAGGTPQPGILAGGQQGVDDQGLPVLKQADGIPTPTAQPPDSAASNKGLDDLLKDEAFLFAAKAAGIDLTSFARLQQGEDRMAQDLAQSTSRNLLTLKGQTENVAQDRILNQFKREAIEREQKFKAAAPDRQLIKDTISTLRTSRPEAVKSANNVKILREMKALAKTGKVTGKAGQAMSAIAPFAEMFGVRLKDFSDAELFQKALAAQIGQFRKDIIGPGSVSEKEQQLMAQVSGGGGTGQFAAIKLIEIWESLALTKINTFNDDLKFISKHAPLALERFKPIRLNDKSKPSLSLGQGNGPKTADEYLKGLQ